MNNYNKIQSMSLDKMAEFLRDKICSRIICDETLCENCQDYIEQWLLSEEEE